VAEGGDGDLRYKLSKESAAKTLSLLFQDNFSGRAEIGLTGDDDFHFKTSPDGSAWNDALTLDKTTGATTIGSGLLLAGDLSPAQITADQNDYSPTGLATASVLRLSSDASRNLTGLGGGTDGRVVGLVNVGSHAVVLKDASASSSAANRFAFGADVTLAARQGAVLWYDATASRWTLLAGSPAGRELLTASRTYYVRADGSDGNDGLTDLAGGAFLTIQKAIDVVARLDLSIHDVVIQVGNGTYTGANVLKTLIGAGSATIRGDVSSPSNVVVSTTSASCFSGSNIQGRWHIEGFKLQTTTSGAGLDVNNATRLTFGAMDFGACAGNHVTVQNGGVVTGTANYTISGNAANHWSLLQATLDISSITVTLSGTPAFSGQFFHAQRLSYARVFGITFSGSATGIRYTVSYGAVVFTNGAGTSYFPGSVAGSGTNLGTSPYGMYL
jgi:hypothetical protein